MKRTIFLIVLSFLLTACPEEIQNDRYYVLENSSNHEIVLKFYSQGNLLAYLTTTLSEDETYEGSIRYQNEDLFSFPSNAFKSDSIEIDFDNVKRRTYTIDFINGNFSEPINRNVFRHENYQDIGNDKFLFVITEEDYNAADDINQ